MKKDLEHFDHDVTFNVTTLLKEIPETRDNDLRLVATYYYKYHQHLVKDKSALDFLKSMAQGHLVSSDLITRTRRKLQEHNPELRGTKWIERHEKQAEVKSDLKKVQHFRKSI
jgi:hypothetical protein